MSAPLCDFTIDGRNMCARPLDHDGDHDPTFNADEWPEPECERCADPIPGMPAHEPSRRCQYRPNYQAHCTCRACFG